MHATTAELAEILQAGNESDYKVTVTTEGWIEVRNNPARQIDPSAKLDYLRIVGGEGEWTVYQLDPKGGSKGQATFVGSFANAVFATVYEFFASLARALDREGRLK